MIFQIIINLLLWCLALSQTANYYGYKIYDINARNAFEKEALLRLSENPAYDFFLLPRALGVPARVMIPPINQDNFENLLKQFGLRYSIINDDFGESLELQQIRSNRMLPFSKGAVSNRTVTNFPRFNNINAYLDNLAREYPKRVTVKTAGKSYEGRQIKTIKITNGDGKSDKNVIFIDAGIHAREWIAPVSALYVVQQLVENFSANEQLLRDYDWIVLPLVNPDGYEYTHTNKRMWRKTRKPVSQHCSGTDGNRNFDFHWGELGASSISCSGTFRGTKAFSEPETRVVRDIMLALSGRAKFYLTLHSFGNYLLYPWGYTSALPSTWQDMDEVAQAGAKAIHAATGTKYTVGSSTNVLYAASGGSDDYAYAIADIPVAITMELSPGGSGFDPTPDQIQPFVEESWIGIKAMAEKIASKY